MRFKKMFKQARTYWRPITVCLLCILTIVVLKVGDQETVSISPGTTITFNGLKQRSIVHPFRYITDKKEEIYIEWEMDWDETKPTRYKFIPDDCLMSLFINNVSHTYVTPDSVYCDYAQGHIIELADYLQVGTNKFVALIQNKDWFTGLRIVDPAREIPNTVTTILFIIMVALFLLGITSTWFNKNFTFPIRLVIITGVLLRLYYSVYTNFENRAYDVHGHLEYIQYIAVNWSLPIGSYGWEFHQQPLYYIICAVIKASLQFDLYSRYYIWLLQIFSVALSIVTLITCANIAKEIFYKSKHYTLKVVVFLSIIATIPSFIFLAPRINNDTLLLCASSFCILYLLRWANTFSTKNWLLACIAFAVAIATKSSALPLAATMGIAYIVTFKLNKSFIKQGLIFTCAIVLTIGTSFIYRAIIQQQTALVPVHVTSGLAVENSWHAFLTFNPIKVLQIPFNDNWTTLSRKEYIWEYLYRSTFFGEWNYKYRINILGEIILATNYMFLLFGFVGIYSALKQKKLIPFILATLTVISLAALVVFRFLHPFCSNQEMRYIAFVLIPMSYFLVEGIASVRYRKYIAIMSLAICLLFIQFILLII